MAVPLFIQVASERARTFRKEVELFVKQPRTPQWSRSDIWDIVRHYQPAALGDVALLDIDQLVGQALQWVHAEPMKPKSEMDQARELIDQALANWSLAWSEVGEFVLPGEFAVERGNWLQESVRNVIRKHRRAVSELMEGWPTSKSGPESEWLAEMRAGKAIELDEAFSTAAGVTPTEWDDRVRRHRTAKVQ